jgi:hypothetical protein
MVTVAAHSGLMSDGLSLMGSTWRSRTQPTSCAPWMSRSNVTSVVCGHLSINDVDGRGHGAAVRNQVDVKEYAPQHEATGGAGVELAFSSSYAGS